MKTNNWLRFVWVTLALSASGVTQAQTSAGSGSVLVFPVVAFTATFTSEVTVQNPNANSIVLDLDYYESNNAHDPGFHDCGQFTVPAGQSLAFTLNAKCPPETGTTHFGILILRHHDPANQLDLFYAYSRAQTASGVGFSIEGFPIGGFSGGTSYSIGIKNSTTTPFYATNCYVAALAEPITYTLTLYDGTDAAEAAPLGTVTASIPAFDSHRYTDVFARLGAGPNNANVKAKFSVAAIDVNGTVPAYIGFCTVQESVTFSADFRIAKSRDALDQRQKRLTCYGQTACGTLTVPPTQVGDPSSVRNVHSMFIAQPDFVRCDLVGPSVSLLQIRLREPGDTFASSEFVPVTPYDTAPFQNGGVANGGPAHPSWFYIYTGERTEWNNGQTARWLIDVEAIDAQASTPALDYGITCKSGNGVSVPYFRGTAGRIPDASF
jgi:hypothetical protein